MKREPFHPQKYIILGLLMKGELHGYAIHRAFTLGLQTISYAGRSYVYSFLKQLEGEGKVTVRREVQSNRPSKNVYSLSPAGRKDFLEWIRTPVGRTRDLRVEFLAKLSLIKELDLDYAPTLINAQMEVCRRLLEKQRSRRLEAAREFDDLVYEFRICQIEAAVTWLRLCKERFEDQDEGHR